MFWQWGAMKITTIRKIKWKQRKKMMQRQRTISSLPKSGFNLLIVHTEFERHSKMLHIFADTCTDAYINQFFVTQFSLHYFDPRYPDLRIPTHIWFFFQAYMCNFILNTANSECGITPSKSNSAVIFQYLIPSLWNLW